MPESMLAVVEPPGSPGFNGVDGNTLPLVSLDHLDPAGKGSDGSPGSPGSNGSPGQPGGGGSPGGKGGNGSGGQPGGNGSPGQPGSSGRDNHSDRDHRERTEGPKEVEERGGKVERLVQTTPWS